MQSIGQNAISDPLPDLRSLGVITRSLLAANAAGLLVAMARADSVSAVVPRFAEIAMSLEPALLASLLALYALAPVLARLPAATAMAAVHALVLAVSGLLDLAQPSFMDGGAPRGTWFTLVCAACFVAVMRVYFSLRSRAFSPALAEARLQALQARIRPHFLFNCINAVLSLVRREPRRAETALEDLAELFRSAMSDNRDLRPLDDELALCRQYLNLEQLRLGERLQVKWDIGDGTGAALVPPMLVQPLVENAIYHGIEPGEGPGSMEITARRSGERLSIELTNPYHPDHQHRQGNRMALENIRERLQLHFDVEASLASGPDGGRYVIRIEMPVRTAP